MNIINLETTLTHSNRRPHKTFNFKTTPDRITSLVNANITITNLANNHILDFANEGLTETIRTLDAANVKHVGAGIGLTDAAAPLVVQRETFTIGVLGLTDNEPGWKANGGPGTNYICIGNKEEFPLSLPRLRSSLKKQILLLYLFIGTEHA